MSRRKKYFLNIFFLCIFCVVVVCVTRDQSARSANSKVAGFKPQPLALFLLKVSLSSKFKETKWFTVVNFSLLFRSIFLFFLFCSTLCCSSPKNIYQGAKSYFCNFFFSRNNSFKARKSFYFSLFAFIRDRSARTVNSEVTGFIKPRSFIFCYS